MTARNRARALVAADTRHPKPTRQYLLGPVLVHKEQAQQPHGQICSYLPCFRFTLLRRSQAYGSRPRPSIVQRLRLWRNLGKWSCKQQWPDPDVSNLYTQSGSTRHNKTASFCRDYCLRANPLKDFSKSRVAGGS